MAEHEPIEVLIARMDERLKGMHAVMDDVRDLLARQNGRISRLERWQSYTTGALAILSAVVAFALSILAAKL